MVNYDAAKDPLLERVLQVHCFVDSLNFPPLCPALQISLRSEEEYICEFSFFFTYPRQYILASIYTYEDRFDLGSVSCCAVPRTTGYQFHSAS